MTNPKPGADRPRRIFIVEDHSDTRRSLASYFEREGFVVFTAGNVEDALREIAPAECDILLSDIGLPDGTGWELVRRLGAARPALAIAMSGYGAPADHTRSLEAGFDHHLLKPLSPDVLGQLIQTRPDAASERVPARTESGAAA